MSNVAGCGRNSLGEFGFKLFSFWAKLSVKSPVPSYRAEL